MEDNREAGENPERSRHCEKGVFFSNPLEYREGEENDDLEPGDLPQEFTNPTGDR